MKQNVFFFCVLHVFQNFPCMLGEKSKSVSFSRVYVCGKAKLTLVNFFYFFSIHLSPSFTALIYMDRDINITIAITIAITIILKFRVKISLVNVDGCMVSVTLFWWPFLQLSISHIPFVQVDRYKLEMWMFSFVTG